MKIKGVVLLLVVLVVMSFNRLNSEKHIVITKDSKVEWKGFKPGGEHFGTIAIKEGSLIVEGDKLISGSFTMDMNSIQLLDSESKKLLNHLKGDDFFDVKVFPTAKFDVSGSLVVKGKTLVKGFLTIKGITKEISFSANIYTNNKGQLVFESETFKINRANYNIKYKSKTFYANLKDKFIYDEFEMKVMVIFSGK